MEINIKQLHTKLDAILKFINTYCTFGEVHMVEFFTQDHWNTLVGCEAQEFLLRKSLSQLRQVSSENCLPRDSYNYESNLHKLNNFEDFLLHCSIITLDSLSVLTPPDYFDHTCLIKEPDKSSTDDLKKLITTKEYMNSKKSHEIMKMAPIVNSICSLSGCDSVIDVGSGKGYLGTYLSMCHNLKVVGIDIDSGNSTGALFRAEKFKSYWTKHLKNKISKDSLDSMKIDFKPVTARIEADTNISKFSENEESYVMVGLHTCGDLCSSVMSLFIKEPKILSLCVVGCCYHLLTEEKNCQAEIGFPKSEYLLKKQFHLGRNNRMVALQSRDRRSQEVLNEPTKSEWSLFYRAVFSVILKENFNLDPNDKTNQVGKIFSKSKDFVDYTRRGLKKLKQNSNLISDDTIKYYYDLYLPKIKSLIAFNVLRQLYSPAVENLIMLDKFLYLKEYQSKGKIGDSFLVRLFDPIESPRCCALIAFKNKT